MNIDPSCPVSEESLIRQRRRNYEELLQPPEIYFPTNEYDQKSGLSNLNSSTSLQHFWRALSIDADRAWQEWVATLDTPLEELMIDPEDQEDWQNTKLAADEEEAKNQEVYEEETFAKILEAWPNSDTLFCDYSAYKYSPSFGEYNNNYARTNFETAVARKAYRADQDEEYIPSTGMGDDPDFIPPSSLVSRNFSMGEPASRPYNATYLIKIFEDENKTNLVKEYKKGPNSARDYTDSSTILFSLRNRGFDNVEIKTLAALWEYDVRISVGTYPDLSNYKKIPGHHPWHQRFLILQNDNPYVELNELAWDTDSGKAVAYYKTFEHKKEMYCIWAPLRKEDVGKYGFFTLTNDNSSRVIYRSRTIYPQIDRKYLYIRPDNDKRVIKHKFLYGAVLRYSAFMKKNIVAAYHNKLLTEYGLQFVKQETQNGIKLDKFLHPQALTANQRKTLEQGLVPADLVLEPVYSVGNN